ncbi:hypothetical protein SK128_009275 [Halocaridina rubra]|uniref:BRCT domain-containing protein n=1 Tax=Halocaridina rubra TaxID=373956 RepID=A0AAN9A674_HALRR
MQSRSETYLLERIIRLIEILGYNGMETLDPSWVRSVLVSNNDAPRQKFMIWIVTELCHSDGEALLLAPQQALSQKILQSLTTLGLCHDEDLELIEGKAPPLTQLKFWCACLEKVSHLRQVSARDSHLFHYKLSSCDVLIDHLAHSSRLNLILKNSAPNVIPGDLKKMYKQNCKSVRSLPLNKLLQETENELSVLRNQYESVDKQWKDVSPVSVDVRDDDAAQQNLCKAVSALNTQLELFQGVYTSCVQPWIGSSPPLELPNTGPVIEHAATKLQEIIKALKSMEEVSQRCEDLEKMDTEIIKLIHNPATIRSALHNIVSENPVPSHPPF